MSKEQTAAHAGTPAALAPPLERLLEFLRQDPDNLPLLMDAAETAIEVGKVEIALRFLNHAETLAPLPPAARNLKGLAALRAKDVETAAALFEELIAEGHDDPVLRANLAWTKAVMGQYAAALTLLDDSAVAASDHGPALKVKMLHHLARLPEALDLGAALLAQYPANSELAGALSVVAMDNGDLVRAAELAARGRDSLDGICTEGLIVLSRNETGVAMERFDHILKIREDQPRAWLGRGLARLNLGDTANACQDLERAAQLFERHIGSWIAAGWAYFTVKDLCAARRCFVSALELDPNFGESHGSIAVIDIAEGNIAEARREAALALRLDRQCFSGALAKSLLAEHDDNPLLAQKIRVKAMHTTIGPDGQTLAKALVAMGLSPIRR